MIEVLEEEYNSASSKLLQLRGEFLNLDDAADKIEMILMRNPSLDIKIRSGLEAIHHKLIKNLGELGIEIGNLSDTVGEHGGHNGGQEAKA